MIGKLEAGLWRKHFGDSKDMVSVTRSASLSESYKIRNVSPTDLERWNDEIIRGEEVINHDISPDVIGHKVEKIWQDKILMSSVSELSKKIVSDMRVHSMGIANHVGSDDWVKHAALYKGGVAIPDSIYQSIRTYFEYNSRSTEPTDIDSLEESEVTPGSLFVYGNDHKIKEILLWGTPTKEVAFLSLMRPHDYSKSYRLPIMAEDLLDETSRIKLVKLIHLISSSIINSPSCDQFERVIDFLVIREECDLTLMSEDKYRFLKPSQFMPVMFKGLLNDLELKKNLPDAEHAALSKTRELIWVDSDLSRQIWAVANDAITPATEVELVRSDSGIIWFDGPSAMSVPAIGAVDDMTLRGIGSLTIRGFAWMKTRRYGNVYYALSSSDPLVYRTNECSEQLSCISLTKRQIAAHVVPLYSFEDMEKAAKSIVLTTLKMMREKIPATQGSKEKSEAEEGNIGVNYRKNAALTIPEFTVTQLLAKDYGEYESEPTGTTHSFRYPVVGHLRRIVQGETEKLTPVKPHERGVSHSNDLLKYRIRDFSRSS